MPTKVFSNKIFPDYGNFNAQIYLFDCIMHFMYVYHIAVLEVTVCHWLFSYQFQHLAGQNQFCLAKDTAHFQWDNNQ